MPNGTPTLLLQVIDSGPGLQGADYRRLFDPTSEFGTAFCPASQISFVATFLVRVWYPLPITAS
jgi:hypothetical protein